MLLKRNVYFLVILIITTLAMYWWGAGKKRNKAVSSFNVESEIEQQALPLKKEVSEPIVSNVLPMKDIASVPKINKDESFLPWPYPKNPPVAYVLLNKLPGKVLNWDKIQKKTKFFIGEEPNITVPQGYTKFGYYFFKAKLRDADGNKKYVEKLIFAAKPDLTIRIFRSSSKRPVLTLDSINPKDRSKELGLSKNVQVFMPNPFVEKEYDGQKYFVREAYNQDIGRDKMPRASEVLFQNSGDNQTSINASSFLLSTDELMEMIYQLGNQKIGRGPVNKCVNVI